ncbi:hypothetical protein V2G26_014037 [Clonostachys chloroleuca]
MKIPYHNAHVCKGIIFAGRSGQLHSFNAQDGSYISTWKHPDAEKVSDAFKAIAEAEKVEADKAEIVKEDPSSAAQEDGDEPPAKRQKTVEAEDTESAHTEKSPVGEAKGKDQAAKKKTQARSARSAVSKVPDRPLIAHITSTADGKHVVVVTAHDKAIWVFEHDLAGNLKELSKRVMPKRPSSVVLGPDSQIICADKFGDVYAVPLIQSETWTPAPSRQVVAKPEANPLTVHSKRNLASLKSQLKQIELNKRDIPNTDGPAFEQTLLLGHVSMLTKVVLGEQEGRRYVLTADRDEHIRVSRYIPQTHVIEAFCLGHKEFVNALTIPRSRNSILVSGGGDPNLFVWNWPSGKLLSQTDILSLAQRVFPTTSEVTVSQLESFDYPSDSGRINFILAICENIKAIFAWELTDENTLSHPSIIQLPGNPLHLAFNLEDESSPKVVVTLDPGSEGAAPSLNIYSFQLSEGTLAIDTTSSVSESAAGESEDLVATETEVKALLYTVEHLRKKTGEPEEEGEKATEASTEGQE